MITINIINIIGLMLIIGGITLHITYEEKKSLMYYKGKFQN